MLTSHRVEIRDSIASAYDFYEQAYEWGWTDGLPTILPTEERVSAFLAYLKRDPGEIVAEIPPGLGVATVEKIAINAVMAGCRPEYLPVLLAAIEAIMEPQFNLNGVQATTNPAAPLLIINGPCRDQLRLNCGSNALGQGCRANATIGRALRFILVNVGGAVPGSVDKATLGQPGKYTFCLGENEEENPWEPLHVERGFSREQSTVTVVGASGTNNIIVDGQNPETILTVIASSMTSMGSNHLYLEASGEPLVILCPSHAAILNRAGLAKSDVKRVLWERARISLDLFPPGLAKLQRSRGRVVDGKVVLVPKPESLMILVAGGPSGLHSTHVPTFGDTIAVTKVVG
ncbi:MAG: hypothetical protein HYX94_12880 [Chloroflexi bacterium]|nr:hypothetical protein [Chloroflexota bacterium]